MSKQVPIQVLGVRHSRPTHRLMGAEEWLHGKRVSLRLLTLQDCTQRYVEWLNDAAVNLYLETRWTPQNLITVREFVKSLLGSNENYLFGMFVDQGVRHVGNIKVGPIRWMHASSELSYFVGERPMWGQGVATEAI